MHNCRMPGCTSVYKNKRDRATHEGVHYVEFGHENALVCEVCSVQHYRRDNLNDHRRKAHGLEGIVAPFVVAEYCGSFKMLRSEGLDLNGTKTVVTILSLINILDDGRGVYCARIVMHIPEYVGDYIHHWDLVDDGPTFEIISERDTCCQCKLFFNTTCDFAHHMQDHHEGNL